MSRRSPRDVDEIIGLTRRQRTVNFGNSADVTGDGPQTLFQMDQEVSSDLLITVETRRLVIPDAAIGTGDFRPYVKLSWGHGGTDVEAEFEVTYRQRIPISASKVNLTCFLKSLPLPQSDGSALVAPVPATATASFRAFCGEGSDAEPLFPTRWIEQMGINAGCIVGQEGQAVLVGQQCRLATLRGWARALGETALAGFLLVFDQATVPVNGDIPVDGFPLVLSQFAGVPTDPGQVPPRAYGQTRAFTQGLAWAISSTPFVLTLVPSAEAFVTVELLQ